MKEVLAQKIVWRRHGVRRNYVGTLFSSDEGIRLTGRDPVSGVEVSLSIPQSEIEGVHVAHRDEELIAGERCVVVELSESEAIFLREVGAGPLRVHMLARSLEAQTRTPQLAVGG